MNRMIINRITDTILLNSTKKSDIERFFSLLTPVKTNHDLIRLGGDSDGGYLIPDDLEGINACFSPGVSDIAHFEEDLTQKGIKCFLADYSVETAPIQSDLIDFEKKFLGKVENDKFITLESWVNRKAPNDNDLILQMDIEGGEYDVISSTNEDFLKKFRIAVIEFHWFHWLTKQSHLPRIEQAFSKLLKNFELVHIHRNNCCRDIHYKGFQIPPVIEFTFLRKDRITNKAPITSLPHELDRKNVDINPDWPLPECWYIRN